MKRNTIRIVITLVMILSIALVTTSPTVAGDGDNRSGIHFAAGSVETYFPGGFGLAWMSGEARISISETHMGQPAKGFIYRSFYISDWQGQPLEFWYVIEVEEVKIVEGPVLVYTPEQTFEIRDGRVAWCWGRAVAMEHPLIAEGDELWAAFGVLDAATPGSSGDVVAGSQYYNGDMSGSMSDEDAMNNAKGFYDAGIAGSKAFVASVVSGNAVVK
ncbi:MAG: hypothetical protein JSV77_08855 [Dehalococcoidales bacterium]|nr:MAG: hypothetical protein JSV77_08855 [Dehalococcoidales bacterium]